MTIEPARSAITGRPMAAVPAPRRARKSTPPTAAASPGDLQLATARADLGQRFGQDFSQVPVHTSAADAEKAAAIGAAAFTVGPGIVLGSRLPAASSPYTRRLFAHEFAHVTQHALAAA